MAGDRIHLSPTAMAMVRTLMREFGLRPLVDAVGTAALELCEGGEAVTNEYGEAMDRDDILTAVHNLTGRDLY